MDAVAGVVTSAFLLSNGIRRDTEVDLLLLADPRRVLRVRLDGAGLKFLNPDERSTAALLKNALAKFWARPDSQAEVGPGIEVTLTDRDRELRAFASLPGACWLVEDGNASLPRGDGGTTVILSDPYEPSPEERSFLKSLGLPKVSLGPHSLHAAHCVVLVHNQLDRAAPAGAPAPSGSPG